MTFKSPRLARDGIIFLFRSRKEIRDDLGGPFIAFDGFEKPNDDDVTSVFVGLIQDGFREAENPFGQFGIPVLD